MNDSPPAFTIITDKVFGYIASKCCDNEATDFMLLDQKLASEFNVSRGSIEAALQQLEQEELINSGSDHMIVWLTPLGHKTVEEGGYIASLKKRKKQAKQQTGPKWTDVAIVILTFLILVATIIGALGYGPEIKQFLSRLF